MKKANLLLLLIIFLYGLIYIATEKRLPCDGDCEKLSSLNNIFLKDSNFIYPIWTCGRVNPYDTICVNIKDTINNNNWNALADSICLVATQLGLAKRQIFIINNFANTPDTAVSKSCP